MASEAQKKAIKKYREKLNRITIDFSPAEAKLWDHLQSQPKARTYIKDLIRADMNYTTTQFYNHAGDYECTKCGHESTWPTAYCPNCGRVVVDEGEEGE